MFNWRSFWLSRFDLNRWWKKDRNWFSAQKVTQGGRALLATCTQPHTHTHTLTVLISKSTTRYHFRSDRVAFYFIVCMYCKCKCACAEVSNPLGHIVESKHNECACVCYLADSARYIEKWNVNAIIEVSGFRAMSANKSQWIHNSNLPRHSKKPQQKLHSVYSWKSWHSSW